MDDDNKKVTVTPINSLGNYSSYKFVVYPGIKSSAGEPIFTGKVYSIKTGMEDSDKFDRIDDEELLTLVQKQTFSYFRDMGSYAVWRATKVTGQYDAKTFQVKARPVEPVDNLRPGMSVLLKRDKK